VYNNGKQTTGDIRQTDIQQSEKGVSLFNPKKITEMLIAAFIVVP
jgi:hypothetical protein